MHEVNEVKTEVNEEYLTHQEVFDKVVEHLYRQGKPAKKGNDCVYRAKDGTMCAVGCLIPDEFYDPKMEYHGVDHFYNWYPEALKAAKIDVSDPVMNCLLRALQRLHDTDENWIDFDSKKVSFDQKPFYKKVQDISFIFDLPIPYTSDSKEH